MNKRESAVKFHNQGFACSQAVLAPFADQFNLDLETALKISCGLGGGIGCTGETCGAVTGAAMVIGLKYGMTEPEIKDNKLRTYEKVQEFIEEFKKLNKVSSCRELLGYDINSEHDKKIIAEKKLSETVCSKVIKDAVEILEGMINMPAV